MKKPFAFALHALLALAGAAQAQLHNNGEVANGAGLSIITLPNTTAGFNADSAKGSAVADNFTVGAGLSWQVTGLDFFVFQNLASVFAFQSVSWSVVAGDVNAGAVVASGTTPVANGGLIGYRVAANNLTDTSRPIYRAKADVADFALGAGAYWLRWSLLGDAALIGPVQAPTSHGAVGNAQFAFNAPFAQALDAGSGLGMEWPFIIEGTVNAVPEPSTYALLLAGGVLVCAVARRRRGARALS